MSTPDPDAITKQQMVAAFGIVAAIGEAIRDGGPVPSGELYARVMGSLTLNQYVSVIDTLVRAKLVTRSGHLLTWVGPKKGEA